MRRTRGRPRHPDVLTPAKWAVALLAGEGLTNEQIVERRRTRTGGLPYGMREFVVRTPDGYVLTFGEYR